MYKNFFKRVFDIFFSFFILIILSPIILVISIIIKCKLGSPIIFKQQRNGKDGKIFTIYKFRSMSNKKTTNGEMLPDIDRISAFGNFLRSYSLDEIPELINILKGDMSFVGPRPLLPKYFKVYTDEEKRRHLVKPGLTGLAQINGRNLSSWEDRFKYDVKYIDSITFFGDIKIIFKTIKKVLKKDDVVIRQNNPMLDLDKQRAPKIEIREIESIELIENKSKLELYIKELFDIANINDSNKKAKSVYDNMLTFKNNGTAIVLGAFDLLNNGLVGFIWGYKKDCRLHVNYFYVDSKYRSMGVGKNLINKIYEVAKARNINEIELMVAPSNNNAINFYKRQGFNCERICLCKKI